jgi:ABC-type branched-subunit amino acid transport system substrate-binding protein
MGWGGSTVIAGVCALALIASGVPAAAQSSNDKPKATDVGITASEIHIAVIADVDTSIQPGLFQGAVDGVKGAAAYLNSKAGGGGVAGRKLVVDFIDSKLNPTTSRNAIITACQNDFATIGTSVVFLSNVEDAVNCKDQSGAATGLPDLPAFTVGINQSCSPVSFPLNPPQLDCATKDASPQTYRGSRGPSDYLLKKFGKLHGAFVYGSDSKDAVRGARAIFDAENAAGIKTDQLVGLPGASPQSAYTPLAAKMKQDGSNYGTSTSDNAMILLRSEAQLQGVSPDVVWSCGCYSKNDAASAALDGTWVNLLYLPLEEASSNPTLNAFRKYVGPAKADQFAVYSWAATLAFAEAAKAVVAKQGVNGLTRKALLTEGLPTLTNFDAGGMIGPTNIAKRIPSTCFVMLHLTKGKYVRAFPSKKGTFDCNPKNAITTKADYIGG